MNTTEIKVSIKELTKLREAFKQELIEFGMKNVEQKLERFIEFGDMIIEFEKGKNEIIKQLYAGKRGNGCKIEASFCNEYSIRIESCSGSCFDIRIIEQKENFQKIATYSYFGDMAFENTLKYLERKFEWLESQKMYSILECGCCNEK